MKFLLISFLSLAAAQNQACPTVTSRTSVCSTCVAPFCLAISTITPVCGCPEAVATTYEEFPCGGDSGCPGGCAGTQWMTATTTACEGAPTG